MQQKAFFIVFEGLSFGKKEYIQNTSFHYVIDHASIRFFFYVNSLHCDLCDSFCTTCCILSVMITSQLSQAYNHTNFLFEYMNFLKIIHEKKFFVMKA